MVLINNNFTSALIGVLIIIFSCFVVSAAPGDNIHIHVTPRISRRKLYGLI